MTIPRIPGMFDSLGQGLNAGFQTYVGQKEQQVERAQAGARLILGLIQAGQIDPAVISDPGFQQTLQTAKIPQPPASTVVPSVKAEGARRFVEQAKTAAPGSVKESLMFDIPGLGSQIGEEELRSGLLAVKNHALRDPAVARIMADVMTPDVAQNTERARSASAASQAYDYAAENFVSQAALEVKKGPDGRRDLAKMSARALQLASADPEYKGLVANGQLSQEYFAKVANRIGRLDEEELIKFADIAARRAAAEREARLHYDAQRKSYDTEIAQLQATIKQNTLSDLDKLFLTGIQKKQQTGQPLTATEMEIVNKVKTIEDASSQIETLTGERADIRDNYVGQANPINPNKTIVPPSGERAAARRSGAHTGPPPAAPEDKIAKLKAGLASGALTRAQIQASPSLTDAEKDQVLGRKKKAQTPGSKP